MKMKSLLASIAACAIAASAMAVTASAKVLNPASGDDKYMFPIVADEGNNLPEGVKLSDIFGFSCKLDKTAGEGETCVGAFCWQSDSNNWDQHEFCQEGGDKDVFVGSDGTVKFVSSSALFAADDTWGKAFVAEWSWEGDNQIDFNVSDFKLLDKDGNVLGAAAETTSAPAAGDGATTTTSTATSAAATTTTAAPGAAAGDAGVAVAVAGIALAGAAAFVARKKD